MSLYWISWYQPTEDYRPLSFPPNNSVLGWWCSGYRADDAATLCAWVIAETEDEARSIVQNDWPEASEWRFCEEREAITPNSRFPLADWMRERVDPYLTVELRP